MKLLLSIFFFLLFSGQILAQGTIFDVDPAKQFHHGSFSFSHPIFDYQSGSTELSSFAGSYTLNLNLSISEHYALHFAVPFRYLSFDNISESESGTGNIRIGLQKIGSFNQGNQSAIQFFVSLPTEDENVFPVGLFTNALEIQNYTPDIYSLTVQFAGRKSVAEMLALNYFGGSTIIFPKEDSFIDEREVFFRFGIEPSINISNFHLFISFKTVGIISDNVDNFSDRFQSIFGFGCSMNLGKYQPKFSYKVYLDEPVKDFIDGVFLVGTDFNLGE